MAKLCALSFLESGALAAVRRRVIPLAVVATAVHAARAILPAVVDAIHRRNYVLSAVMAMVRPVIASASAIVNSLF